MRIDSWERCGEGTTYKSETHSSIKLRDVPPCNFNRAQAAMPGSPVRPLGLNLADFIGSFLWPPTITSAATWLSGGLNERQEGGSGISSSLHSSRGSSQGQWPSASKSCSDLMDWRKWLMRSGISFGDAGLPRSTGRWSCPSAPPPQTTSAKFFTICAPWPSPLASAQLLRRGLKRATSRALYSLLHSILGGRMKRG